MVPAAKSRPTASALKVEARTKPQLVRDWREGWAQVQNAHLQLALGREAPQVSAKSLADRGVGRDPTIHLGRRPRAWSNEETGRIGAA